MIQTSIMLDSKNIFSPKNISMVHSSGMPIHADFIHLEHSTISTLLAGYFDSESFYCCHTNTFAHTINSKFSIYQVICIIPTAFCIQLVFNYVFTIKRTKDTIFMDFF